MVTSTLAVLSAAPVATLSNGLRIANFSSGHAFAFTDGTVLEPCTDSRVRTLALRRDDVEERSLCGRFFNVQCVFILSDEVKEALDELENDDTVDVVLCPLPVITACHDAGRALGKARTIIRANRETTSGPGLIRIDRFGI
jgi:hypothetical protein